MKPLRVLHVDTERGFSGGQTQVLALARLLAAWGHGSWIASDPQGELAARAVSVGVAVQPLRCARSHDPRAALALRRLVRALAPDVVHLHTARALSLAPHLPRGPLRVVTRRMDYPPRGAGLYVRWLYGSVDAVIAISQAVAEALAARGVPRQRVVVVPSGVDVERFAEPEGGREAARRMLGLGEREPVIAIVASLHERKGHAVLLGALQRLAARGAAPLCLAAGAGPEGEALRMLAARLGVAERVRWLGQLRDAREVLLAADLLVLPSLAEGLGVAAIEAMAAGRPVVASRVGGLAELVRDGIEGALVPAADQAALAEALDRLLSDGGLRARLGAAAVRRARDFSVEAMARGTEAVYERARARRNAGRADDGGARGA